MLTPVIIEKTPTGERSYDIYSRLLKDRIIWLQGAVTEGTLSTICSQMLFLDKEKTDVIQLYINSPGGIVTEGLGVYDVMNSIKSPVSTVVVGQACSMGSVLAANGEKGMRYMMPSARHMIHRVSGGAQGTIHDMEASVEEARKLNEYLTECYVQNTGQTYDKLFEDMKIDKFMSAQESIDYGLADHIIEAK